MKQQGQRVARLVATQVATLGPGDYTDPATRGLQLRVRPTQKGFSRTWLYRFKVGGHGTRISLGRFPAVGLADARRRAQEAADNRGGGIDPRGARRHLPSGPDRPPEPMPADTPADPHSVDFLVFEFVHRYVRLEHRRPAYAERLLTTIVLPRWKGRDARTIEAREVVELVDRVVDGAFNQGGKRAPVMGNRVAALLGRMFKYGVQRAIVNATPVVFLTKPGGKETPRTRALSAAELAAFVQHHQEACRAPRLAHALMVLLLTGQRRGELAAAKWRDVDLKAALWTIPAENSKTGKGHNVPLSPQAVAELRNLKRLARRSAYVFPREDGKSAADPVLITRGVARCLKRFGKFKIAPFTAHDLRRTCRTGLAALGVSAEVGERILNHHVEGMEGIYNRHDFLDRKRAALESWGAHIDQLRNATEAAPTKRARL